MYKGRIVRYERVLRCDMWGGHIPTSWPRMLSNGVHEERGGPYIWGTVVFDTAGVGTSTGMEERGREESRVDSCSTEVEIEEVEGTVKELWVRGSRVAYSRPSPSKISAAINVEYRWEERMLSIGVDRIKYPFSAMLSWSNLGRTRLHASISQHYIIVIITKSQNIAISPLHIYLN